MIKKMFRHKGKCNNVKVRSNI